jgi:hypothetical protein
MIEVKPLEDGHHVEVSFVQPAAQMLGPVFVAGDFNDWDPNATVLDRFGEHLVATVTVRAGRRYAFRYFSDGRWFNDEAADAYEPNAFGGHDCVVDLTTP